MSIVGLVVLKIVKFVLPTSHFFTYLSDVNRSITSRSTNFNMSVFTQILNPITGQKEWNLQPEEYDYKQEIARSSYADMLHDQERNDLYFEGIRRCVSLLREQKKEVHVLDIGTGTGLLSMMALSCGVDSVTACEAFTPMAHCASKIFEINGFSDKVNLIWKRSTDIECGEGKEMPRRANLLVTEVFDTELIGEGAIETFSHAKENLLTADVLIVPCEATVYAQVISSDLVRNWNKIRPIISSKLTSVEQEVQKLLNIPDSVRNCPGAAAVHDVQLSQVPRSCFSALSKPIKAFEFDWSGRKKPLLKDETTFKSFEGIKTGVADAVFMWWDLTMDPMKEVVLSCAPVWNHPLTRGKPNDKIILPWRDHWMQGVYYLPKPVEVKETETFTLISSHDEYSLWFSLSDESSCSSSFPRPICECGLHATVSRTRLGQLNDSRRTSLYIQLLERHVTKDSICLFLGDCCLMGIVAAQLGSHHVYIHQTSGIAKRILRDFIVANKVEGKVSLLSSHLSDTPLDSLVGRVSLVFSEPYFDTSMLPWHSLQFLYRLRAAEHLLEDDAIILPHQLKIRALPVQFRDLWKIRSSLHTCSGFNLDPFDKMIEKASDEADEIVEPQPLWEYPAIARGLPLTLISLPLSKRSLRENVAANSSTSIQHSGAINGVALWAEWEFGSGECLSTGPIEDVVPGDQVVWDMYTRQGVYLIKESHQKRAGKGGHVTCTATFDPSDGLVNFEFNVED